MSDQRNQPEVVTEEEQIPTTAQNVSGETKNVLKDVLKGMNVELDEEALKLVMEEGGKEFDKIFTQIAAQQALHQGSKKSKK
ncbi:unnamed protein product [Bursaphelenchus xylophilus]|uniref:(pine wood nematode) hypothetical protein n=1 Tax=Bursaphelenchus xylophilus TaxID=6326 RepID=A0A1I7SSN2_BURXY|nr:unnamed protein product [Bursaphelenchus xylophilus]CAG9097378.1 unnamed protein product [Bursaphelenchus xylophilus]